MDGIIQFRKRFKIVNENKNKLYCQIEALYDIQIETCDRQAIVTVGDLKKEIRNCSEICI